MWHKSQVDWRDAISLPQGCNLGGGKRADKLGAKIPVLGRNANYPISQLCSAADRLNQGLI